MLKNYPKRSDDVNIEYKLKLLNLSENRKEQLVTQLNLLFFFKI